MVRYKDLESMTYRGVEKLDTAGRENLHFRGIVEAPP